MWSVTSISDVLDILQKANPHCPPQATNKTKHTDRSDHQESLSETTDRGQVKIHYHTINITIHYIQ